MQSDSKTFHSTTNTFTQENMAQPTTFFRTTTPSTAMIGRTTTKQVNPVQVPQSRILFACPPTHESGL